MLIHTETNASTEQAFSPAVKKQIIKLYHYVICLSYFEQMETEPPHDKTNKMTAPSEDSDQPGYPPGLRYRSLFMPGGAGGN